MANINKELNQIKNAIYGKEVRGSIHDGIKKINDESEESKSKADEAHDVMESILDESFDSAALESNFEQKLEDKIDNLQPEWTGFKDDITSQLAETATKEELQDVESSKMDKNTTDIGISQINKNKGLIDETYLSDELKQQMAGNTPIHSTPANKSITKIKMAENAISPTETTFARLGKNKFDGVFVRGHASGVNDARWNDSNAISAIVKVEPNKRYVISKSSDTDRFAVYSSKTYPDYGDSITNRIISNNDTATVTLSNNDNYLIINLSSPDQQKEPSQFMVEEREEGGPAAYVPPKIVMDFENESISSESLLHVSNYGLLVGAPRNFTVNLLSQTISVTGENVWIVSGGNRYNVGEGEWSFAELISQMNGVIVAYDTNLDEILFIRSTDKEQMKKDNIIVLGNIRDDGIERDCFFFGVHNVIGKDNSGNHVFLNNDLFVANSYMEINEERSVPDNEDITVNYIHGIYNDLASEFPNYVTKSILGKASDNQDILKFDFKLDGPMNTTEEYEQYPRIFIQGGLHGHEWGGTLAVARFFDNLCRNWRDNEGFKRMRSGVHFTVIPVVNPYGRDYSAGGGGGVSARKNANRVDINSNFPSGWVYNGDLTSTTTSGEEPLSEPETQLIYNYMMDNQDIKFMIDVHNFGDFPREENSYALWYASSIGSVKKMIRGVGTRVITEFKARHESLDDEQSSILSLYDHKTGGAVHEWFASAGVLSALLELPYTVDLPDGGDSKILASKLSQEALGNLMLGILDKYPYLK